MRARLVRVAEHDRRSFEIKIDGAAVTALYGDTLLTAVLTQAAHLRLSDFGDGPRAGFCLMGACQDCWMWTSQGERVRACTTVATPGLSVLTTPPPEAKWPIPA